MSLGVKRFLKRVFFVYAGIWLGLAPIIKLTLIQGIGLFILASALHLLISWLFRK